VGFFHTVELMFVALPTINW